MPALRAANLVVMPNVALILFEGLARPALVAIPTAEDDHAAAFVAAVAGRDLGLFVGVPIRRAVRSREIFEADHGSVVLVGCFVPHAPPRHVSSSMLFTVVHFGQIHRTSARGSGRAVTSSCSASVACFQI